MTPINVIDELALALSKCLSEKQAGAGFSEDQGFAILVNKNAKTVLRVQKVNDQKYIVEIL